MASWLCQLHGLFAKAALLAGAFAEWGGSPLPLAEALPGWAAYKMRLYALFQDVWPRVSGGQPFPDQENLSAMHPAIETMTAAAERARLPVTGIDQIVATWFDLEDWLKLMTTLMARQGSVGRPRRAEPTVVRATSAVSGFRRPATIRIASLHGFTAGSARQRGIVARRSLSVRSVLPTGPDRAMTFGACRIGA